MPFLITKKTGEDESVTFKAESNKEAAKALDEGHRVTVLTPEAYARRHEKLLQDTIFDSETIPY